MHIRQADFSENLCTWPYGGMLFLFEHFVAAENEMKGVRYLAHRCVI